MIEMTGRAPAPVLPPDVEELARRLLALKALPLYARAVLERYVRL